MARLLHAYDPSLPYALSDHLGDHNNAGFFVPSPFAAVCAPCHWPDALAAHGKKVGTQRLARAVPSQHLCKAPLHGQDPQAVVVLKQMNAACTAGVNALWTVFYLGGGARGVAPDRAGRLGVGAAAVSEP